MLADRMRMAGHLPVTISNTAHAYDASNASAYTFSSAALGTARGNRQIVVGLEATGGTVYTLSSVTIGGISASVDIQTTTSNDRIAIVRAAVPTGTTGDIVVTFSNTFNSCAIGVWAVYGASTGAASDTASSSADPPSTTACAIPAQGVAVGFVRSNANSGGAFAWTGLTEDFDVLEAGEGTTYSGASDAFATAQASPTITATPAGNDTRRVMVVASYARA